MAESRTPSENSLQTQQPLFGLLTTLAGLSLAIMANNLVLHFLPPLPQRHLFFLLMLGVLGLGNSLLHYLLIRSASPGDLGSRSIRQFILLILLAYGCFSLVSLADGPGCFLPGLLNVSGIATLALAASIDFSLRVNLFSRQTLYGLIAETSDETLMERFSRQQEIVFDAYQEMASLRRMSTVLLVSGIAVTAAISWAGALDPINAVLFCLLLLSSGGLMSLANTYAEEHRFFLFGIATPFRFQRIRQNWAYALVAVCLVPAFLLAADRSLLDPEKVGVFLAWLASHLKFGAQPSAAEMQKLAEALMPPARSMMQDLPAESGNSLQWLPILFAILKLLGLAAILAGVAWFLAKPLFEKGFTLRQSLVLFLRRSLRLLSDPLRRLGRFLASILDFLRIHLQPLDRGEAKPASVRDYLKHLMASNANVNSHNPDHRRQRKSLQLYGEFLEWAVKRGLKLDLADTPADIATKTLALLPAISTEQRCDLIALGELLELDLFSRNGWQTNESATMRTALDRLESLEKPD